MGRRKLSIPDATFVWLRRLAVTVIREGMRILLWYWGRRGGGAQYALGLAQAMARDAKIKLSLAVSAQCELLPAFQALGVPYQAVDTLDGLRGLPSMLLRVPMLRQSLLAQARQADVVLSAMAHPLTPLLAPVVGRMAAYVPVVHDAQPHPGDPAFAWHWRLDRELTAASVAVCLSDEVARALAARHPAVPLIRSSLPALLAQERVEASPADAPEFLFFGRLRRYKGLDVLRDAFAEVRSRNPGVRLRVVGEGDAEGAAPGLSAVPGVTLEQRWVSEAEIPQLLASARSVVLPYQEASQSGVAVQALALGVPVLATPIGGLPEQVRPGRGGMLAAAATVDAVVAMLEAALAPGVLDRLREEALAARPVNPWDIVATEMLEGLRRWAPRR